MKLQRTRWGGLLFSAVFILSSVVSVCVGQKNCKSDPLSLTELPKGSTRDNIKGICNATCDNPPTITRNPDSKFNFYWKAVGSSNTYQLFPNDTYDRDTMKEDLVTLHNYCEGFGQLPLTIFVNGIDEFPLNVTFQDANRTIEIAENDLIGKPLFQFTVVDKDKPSDFNNVAYNFTGTLQDKITCTRKINETYKCWLKSMVDFDSPDIPAQSTLTLHVTDGSKPVDNNATILTVIVKDFDDLGPAFNHSFYSCSAFEGVKNTEVNCTPPIHAYDQDRGINAPLTYTIVNIHPNTSAITIAANGSLIIHDDLDRENVSGYSIFIKAYQTNRSADRQTVSSAFLTVLDVDDNYPTIDDDVYSVTIPENSPVDMSVLQVSATDIDMGENAQFTYNVSGKDLPFKINSTTGAVSVSNPSSLDREKHKFFVFNVSAEGTKSSKPSVINVTLSDENDNNPAFSPSTDAVTINKTSDIGTQIYNVSISDDDLHENGRFNVWLKNNETFSLQNRTLSVARNLSENFKGEITYTVMILAEDQALSPSNRRSSYMLLNVTVLDVNVNAPQFCNTSLTLNVSESVEIEYQLAFICASDLDPSDTLNISIESGNTENTFSLENRYLMLKKKLDREVRDSYSLTLVATDGLHNTTMTIQLNVEDVNDNNPKFDKTSPEEYFFYVMEETLSGDVGNVYATDKDTGQNGIIAYALVTNWNDTFALNNSTGELSMLHTIDREGLGENDTILITVLAYDGGVPRLEDTATVQIKVNDIDDNPPRFDVTAVNITIKEMSTPTGFHTAKATDPDEGENADIRYRSDSKLYVVNNRTGVMRAVDVVNVTDFTSVEITAYNPKRPNNNSTQTINIFILDVNNNSPRFDEHENCTFVIPENFNGSLHNFTATDDDTTTLFNTVTYWLSSNSTPFAIDIKTGELSLNGPVDYEETQSYKFVVYASDMQPFYNTDTVSNVSKLVIVTITDIDDNSPKFDKDFYEFELSTNATSTTDNCVSSKDADSDKNKTFSFGIQQKFPSLNIDNSTGCLVVKDANSLKDVTSVYLNVTVTDAANHQSWVRVYVNVVNHRPYFTNTSYTFLLQENNVIDQVVGAVHAVDLDDPSGKNITFYLNSTDWRVLQSGVILANKTFDYEESRTEYLEVTASDMTYNTPALVTIQIQNENDNAPQFNSTSYAYMIDENTYITITNITATDKDTGQNGITAYALVTNWNDTFALNNSTGELSMLHTIDREGLGENDTILITVLAYDGGVPRLEDTATVNIKVNDIDDNPPRFDVTAVNITIKEMSTPTGFHTAKATDPDEGENADIRYRSDSKLYVVNNRTGVMRAVDVVNVTGFTSVEITAYNPKRPNNNSTQTINIFILDVNNNSPRFDEHENCTFVIPENFNGSLHNFTATDDDTTTLFNTVTYWLSSNSTPFAIDIKTGELSLNGPVDYEETQSYKFVVYASDMQPFYNTDTVSNVSKLVIVTITDIDDNSPKFDKDFYEFELSTNATSTTDNCVSSKDADSDKNKTFSFGIQQKFPSLNIDNSTGCLVVKDANSLKDVTSVYLNVTVTDAANHQSWVRVYVNVVNHRPYFTNTSYTFLLQENNVIDQVVGAVHAVDLDDPSGKNITFYLNSTDWRVLQSGVILANKTFDYEESRTEYLEVTASDMTYNTPALVTIQIQNENDNAPQFNSTSYAYMIDENTYITITNITATDKDTGQNGITAYALVTNWNDTFALNNSTGELSMLHTIDREGLGENDTILITVLAYDGGVPRLEDTATVNIKVNDIDDNPPRFDVTAVNITIKEMSTPTGFHTAKATDPDEGENADIRYRSDSKLYVVNNRTGVMRAVDVVNVTDFTSVEITAYNPKRPNNNSTQTINIFILDVNNNSPRFDEHENCTFVIPENFNGSLHNFTATDDDTTTLFNTVTYWLSSNSTPFAIDIKTGELSLNGPVDYEETQSYKFVVYASDMQPFYNTDTLSNVSKLVIVTITDIDDNSPKFDKDFYEFELSTNATSTTDNCVSSKDADSDKNKTFSFGIQQKFPSLNIDNSTGCLVVKDANSLKDVTSVYLNVTVTDAANHQSWVRVYVNVVNHRPYFTNTSYTFLLQENNVIDQVVGAVHAVDLDDPSGKNITFYLNSTDWRVLQSGVILANKTFDYEESRTEYLEVTASDMTYNTPALVTIQIQNENDNAPQFNSTSYAYMIDENTYITITNITATDKDTGQNGITAYALVTNWNDTFALNNSTGELSMLHTIDREGLGENDTILITVLAYDGGVPRLEDTATVNIKVNDIDDNPPRFDVTTINITIKEMSTPTGFHTAKATDPDEGENADIRYRSDSKLYVVNNRTGVMRAVDVVNVTGFTSVEITAYNPKRPNNNSTQTINIFILDVNNNSPRFDEHENCTFVIPENFNGSLHNFTATDDDNTTLFNTVAYWLSSNSTPFAIDINTGELSLNGPVDYEETQSYKFVVYASDMQPFYNTDTVSNVSKLVIVTITDIDDNSPKFDKDFYEFELSTNATSTTDKCVSSTDADSDKNKTFSFGIQQKFPSLTIDNSTGCLVVKDANLLTDVTSVYLNVTVTDAANHQSWVRVHVKVVNHRPYFTNNNYTFLLPENNMIGQVVGDMQAIDLDDPSGEHITFCLNSTDWTVLQSGVILANKTFDYEESRIEYLEVTVSDMTYTTTALVTIQIQNENDNAPQFNSTSYAYIIDENTYITITNITAEDIDYVDGERAFNFFFLDGDQRMLLEQKNISIDNTTGHITVNRLDREKLEGTDGVILLKVVVMDNGQPPRSGEATVNITVNDINDNEPYFSCPGSLSSKTGCTSPLTASIYENKLNTSIIKIAAHDDDINSMLTFNVIGGKYDNLFYFNNNDPVLYTSGLDRELQGPYCLVNISVTDGTFNNYKLVNVTIQDVNDNAPVFINVTHELSIKDTLTIGSVVTNLSMDITDPDPSNQGFTYILRGGGGDLVIDDITGVITIVSGHLKPTYPLVVTAYDYGSPPLKNHTNITVTVTETNRCNPTFNDTVDGLVSYNISENENILPFQLNVTDCDESSDFLFSIVSQNNDNTFRINNATGVVTVKPDFIFDYENKSEFQFVVKVVDDAKFRKTSSATVSVSVQDGNDRPEVYVDSTRVYLEMNKTEGTLVTRGLVSDEDKDIRFRQNVITCDDTSFKIQTLDSGYDNQRFEVLTNDTITVLGTTYLTISVNDEVNDPVNTTIAIIVTDINLKTFETSVNESVPVGTMVFNFSKEADLHDLDFNLEVESPAFNVTSEGVVYTSRLLDREQTRGYTLHIHGRNADKNVEKAIISLSVFVLDANDNAPIFKDDIRCTDVWENAMKGMFVCDVTATDKDINSTLTYHLEQKGEYFAIDDNGTITVAGQIDRDGPPELPNITLTVVCTDSIHNVTTNITLNIRDENDNGPAFKNTNIFVDINETADVGSRISTVAATDLDTNGTLSYSLTAGNVSFFSIDKQSGEVNLNKTLDVMNTHLYLEVTVNDTIHTNSTMLDIYVKDVNNHCPKFNKPSYEFNIANGPHQNVIMDVSATDEDAGNNSRIKFSLSGHDPSIFSISTENDMGTLHIARDIQSLELDYKFTVMATDMGDSPCSSSVPITVRVMDHVVTFSVKEFIVEIPENIPDGNRTELIDLNSIEEQRGYSVNYQISQIIPQVDGVFEVNSSTGMLYCTTPLDRELQDTYQIVVSAKLAASRQKRETVVISDSNTVTVSVRVLDVNDHHPTFSETVRTDIGVSRAAGKDYLVVTLVATDADSGDNGQISYTLVGGDVDTFLVGRDTGEIRTNVRMRNTTKDLFTLVVQAADLAGLASTMNITIFKLTMNAIVSLVVEERTDSLKKHQAIIARNMSDILGVQVHIQETLPHVQLTSGTRQVVTSTSDLFFYGINKTSNTVVPFRKMQELIANKMEKLMALFHVIQVPRTVSPSAWSATHVILICISVIIFIFSGAAIAYLEYYSFRYNKSMKKMAELHNKRRESRASNTIELSSLRSRQSSKLAPVLKETTLTSSSRTGSSQRLKKNKTSERVYESQELRMNFSTEGARADEAALGFINNGFDMAQSIDSGMEVQSAVSSTQPPDRASNDAPSLTGGSDRSEQSNVSDMHSAPVHRTDLSVDAIIETGMSVRDGPSRGIVIDNSAMTRYQSASLQSLDRASSTSNGYGIDLDYVDTGETSDGDFVDEYHDNDEQVTTRPTSTNSSATNGVSRNSVEVASNPDNNTGGGYINTELEGTRYAVRKRSGGSLKVNEFDGDTSVNGDTSINGDDLSGGGEEHMARTDHASPVDITEPPVEEDYIAESAAEDEHDILTSF